MTFFSPGSWLLISMLQTTIAGSLPKPSWLAERERHGQTLVVLDIDDDRSGVCPQLIVGYMPLQSAADLRAQQEWLSNNMFHASIEVSEQQARQFQPRLVDHMSLGGCTPIGTRIVVLSFEPADVCHGAAASNSPASASRQEQSTSCASSVRR